ncbi:PH domain-containing protein [Rossellomorea sp. NPDC071047]|uniref:PH domain-containing protein n=1 Tax=Rossellomorea sp. NPDC071047 TaxID=3390675 RepID=UPI003D03F76A
MKFRSKIDRFFISVIFISLLLISIVFLIPLILMGRPSILDIIVVVSLYAFSAGIIIWTGFFQRYELCPDYLYIKGGPFRSRIFYGDLTRVRATRDISTGYRILSSRDALEIYYRTGFWGSVKISPLDKELFLSELDKRCSHLFIQSSPRIDSK